VNAGRGEIALDTRSGADDHRPAGDEVSFNGALDLDPFHGLDDPCVHQAVSVDQDAAAGLEPAGPAVVADDQIVERYPAGAPGAGDGHRAGRDIKLPPAVVAGGRA